MIGKLGVRGIFSQISSKYAHMAEYVYKDDPELQMLLRLPLMRELIDL